MTDDFAPNPIPAAAEPEKTRWGRGPLIIAFAFPIVFVLLALGVLGYGLMKDAAQKSIVSALPSAATISADSEKDSEIARLTAELNALRVRQAQASVETPQTPTYADPTALNRLSERLDRLEANQRLLIQAAAAATSASGLQQAAKGSQPFLSELADVEKSLTDTVMVAPLRPLAQKGVPSEIALALSFPAYAAKARTAASAKTDDSFLTRLTNALSGLISIRRIDGAARGPDALLLQAQGRLDQGDLNGALTVLSTLPPASQAALKPWMTDARNRVLVDTTTRRITVEALSRLSQANYSTANGADATAGSGAAVAPQPETGL
jgi:hypothetical protein